MKKLLLFTGLLVSSFSNAQILHTEDFNGLDLGNVGTLFDGSAAGLGGWYTEATNGGTVEVPSTSTNAGNANFQIVANGFGGTRGLKITSPNGNGGGRFMWNDTFLDAWEDRNADHDYLEVELDFYTGATTTSTAQAGVRLYGVDETGATPALRTIVGFAYTMSTRAFNGVAYLKNGATYGTFLINFGAGNTALTLQANSWYKVGFAYDVVTGYPIWSLKDSTGAFLVENGTINAANLPFPTSPIDWLYEIDFQTTVPATNAAASEVVYDNFKVEATEDLALLGLNKVGEIFDFSVYPNPVTDVLNIIGSGDSFISSVEIYDINGRLVKSSMFNTVEAQLNTSDLSAGVYSVKISSDLGVSTKKIVKQ
jgi:hypothetical protein